MSTEERIANARLVHRISFGPKPGQFRKMMIYTEVYLNKLATIVLLISSHKLPGLKASRGSLPAS